MTFKVLIIEDNHSFIDSLKVMLRDLPLDFVQAFRYNDAIQLMDKTGVFYNRLLGEKPENLAADEAGAVIQAVKASREKPSQPAKLFHEGGVFLVIVEQNTETSMKGTDFVAHAVKRYPGLAESDFVILTHRMDAIPQRTHGFPVLEKPLRAVQLRQILTQKIKQAQDMVDMQDRVVREKTDHAEKEPSAKPTRKGFRDLLKMNRSTAASTTPDAEEKKAVRKTRKAGKPATPKKKARATTKK
jgi:CheY-like chemotaxis protein